MSDLSSYAENKLLEQLLGVTDWNFTGTVYVALYDGDPEGTGTEVSATNYDRKSASWTVSGDHAYNSSDITYDQASSDWAGGNQIDYFALYDDPSVGNMLASAVLNDPKYIQSGSTAYFASGELDVYMD